MCVRVCVSVFVDLSVERSPLPLGFYQILKVPYDPTKIMTSSLCCVLVGTENGPGEHGLRTGKLPQG